MESLQNLKKRIKSIGNIKKITKAMELVAATKMRKSQQTALDSRPYAFAALDLLANISQLKESLPILMQESTEVKDPVWREKTLLVLVASDKGLAGAFNSAVFRKFDQYVKQNQINKNNASFIAVGEKSANHLSKKGFHIAKKFTSVGDFTTPEQVQPLAEFLVQGYLQKQWYDVMVFSTHFRSALKQETLIRQILPVSFKSIEETVKEIIPEKGKFAELAKEHNIQFVPNKDKVKEYTIEPSSRAVLKHLVEHLFFMQVYQIILEANASEHSARRMAMQTASDNAGELGEALNLQYNKSRQAAITNQIIEIIAGAESLN
jgi:F-type H+-transporting ATPase subunit gamma